MTNELTDVRCPCGAEFQADSYDAGFIAGSGMCQNCDAALPPKDICTCPSGDGSLRHPCPAHPAVEQAGGDERAAFERAFTVQEGIYFDDKRGEYRSMNLRAIEATDAQDLNLRLQGWQARAALAQPSPVRSSLLINGYQLRAALDFIAPDGTAEQLESEACIEWRQQDADFLEAGLYAFCAEYPEEGGVLLDEEPTTAQPSPLQSEQAEAERPAVVGYRSMESGMVYVEARQCDECQHGGINDSATGVAACHECDWTGQEPEEDRCPGCQRENCMAAACPQCGARYVLVASEEIAAPVAQAQQLNDLDKQCRDDVARALGLRPNQERGFAWSYLLASIKSCVKASGDSAQAQHSVPEEFIGRLSEFLAQRGATGKALLRELRDMLAAAPGKEGV